MLQVSFIRDHKEEVIKGLSKRNIDATEMVNSAIDLDEQRRSFQTDLDNIKAESNKISKEIGMLFKSGEVEKANGLKEKTLQLKENSKDLE